MKALSVLATAVALITRAVTEVNVVGPFALRITGKTNPSVDGAYNFHKRHTSPSPHDMC